MLRELTGLYHKRNDSIDGGPGNLSLPVLEGIGQGVHCKVGAQFEYLFSYQQPLIRNLQISLFQEIGEVGEFTVNICCFRHG